MDLNLSGWIERRKRDVGPYADHIIKQTGQYEREIERLRAELVEAEQRGYAKAMEAERILYDQSLKIAMRDIHNDAIEAAALEIDCGGQCGACGSHGHCYSELAATIHALKK